MHATTVLGLIFLAGLSIAEKAPPKCHSNERLELCNVCPQPSCKHQDIQNKPCRLWCNNPGCSCAEGYYRDDRHERRVGIVPCVTKDECDLR